MGVGKHGALNRAHHITSTSLNLHQMAGERWPFGVHRVFRALADPNRRVDRVTMTTRGEQPELRVTSAAVRQCVDEENMLRGTGEGVHTAVGTSLSQPRVR